MRIILIGALCVLLAGCGNTGKRGLLDSVALKAVGGLLRGKSDAPEPITFTRASFVGIAQPVLFLTFPENGVQASVVEMQRNGDLHSYISADNILLMFKNDVIVGTRGLGDDLMSADVAQTTRALAAGGGTVDRSWWYLDSLDNEVHVQRTCHIRGGGRETVVIFDQRFESQVYLETCADPVAPIENRYWVSAGKIVKSVQYVSAGIGSVQFERVQ